MLAFVLAVLSVTFAMVPIWLAGRIAGPWRDQAGIAAVVLFVIVMLFAVIAAGLSEFGISALIFVSFVIWQVFFSSDPLARTLHGNDRAAAKAWLERARRVNMANGTNSTGTKPHDGTSTEARSRPTTQAPTPE